MTYPVGSVGLTLVEANYCIMLEPWYVVPYGIHIPLLTAFVRYCYTTHLQALFRLWRIGQQRRVTVYWMLTKKTVERNVRCFVLFHNARGGMGPTN